MKRVVRGIAVVVVALVVGAVIWLVLGWDLWPHRAPIRDDTAYRVGWYGAFVPFVFATGAVFVLPVAFIARRIRRRVTVSAPASWQSPPPAPPRSPR